MRLFNDIIDLGITNEKHLNMINFFVYVHLIAFCCLFGIIMKGAFKTENEVFAEDVARLKKQVKPDNKKNQ